MADRAKFHSTHQISGQASDEFTVPLCRGHHRAAHRAGDERAWWKASGINPIKIARQLWTRTRRSDPGFEQAYWNNRTAAIESMLDADPVAGCVRAIMAERSIWNGSASDLLRAGTALHENADWPKTPRALAGRLRRAQTFLRTLGIEITFSREGRAGTQIIRMTASQKQPPSRSSAPSALSAALGGATLQNPASPRWPSL